MSALASLVRAYDRMAAHGEAAIPASAVGFQGALASVAQIEGMFAHLEEALPALEGKTGTHVVAG